MAVEDIPLLGMLKANLAYNEKRQSLIATNVANADTPGFTPADLKDFQANLSAPAAGSRASPALVLTNPSHIASAVDTQSVWATETKPDSEVRLDGNGVVLEEQMMKANDTQGDFVAGIGLYQRSLELLHTARKKAGS